MANSIILIPSNPTPPSPTQILQQQANNLAIQQANAFRTVVSVFSATTAFIWGDPTKAQSKFDAFTAAGFKASDLVTNAEAAIALIGAITGVTPPSPVPDGYSLTIHPDNSVTVVPPVTPPLS
jgi:hypothetical protein